MRLGLGLVDLVGPGGGRGDDNGYVEQAILFIEYKIGEDCQLRRRKADRLRLGNEKVVRLCGCFAVRKFGLDGIKPGLGR